MNQLSDEEKDIDFKQFLDCLFEAGTGMDDEHYFQVYVAGSENNKYLERVYCYELYHQLRCKMKINGKLDIYKLDGEHDKAGHPIIKGKPKPDFIVSKPKSMEKNLVLIEVKPITAYLPYIKNDIKKLKLFIKNYKYFRGILLIYGNDNDGLLSKINSLFFSSLENSLKDNSILLIWHKGPRETPEVVTDPGPANTKN